MGIGREFGRPALQGCQLPLKTGAGTVVAISTNATRAKQMQRTGQEPRKVRASGIEFDCVSLTNVRQAHRRSTPQRELDEKPPTAAGVPGWRGKLRRADDLRCCGTRGSANAILDETSNVNRRRARETLPGQSQNGTALTFCPQGPVLLGGVSTLHDACSPVTLVTRLPVTAVMYVRARNADNQWKCHKRHNESVGASVFKANPLKNQPFLMWWLAKPRSSRF